MSAIESRRSILGLVATARVLLGKRSAGAHDIGRGYE
jgi:hypothetical protein